MWNHPILKAKTYKDQAVAYAHEKLDGQRVTVFKQSTGLCYATTTTGNQLDLSYLQWWFSFVRNLPEYSSVDGELYVPGKPRGYVKTCLANHLQDLQFTAFAVPYYHGQPLYDQPLRTAHDLCTLWGIPFADYEKVPVERNNSKSLLSYYIQQALQKEIEGYVLKQANYIGWYKVKPVKTIDVIVTGFTEGEGKYIGLVGALCCSVYYKGRLIEIARASGMNNATRYEIDEGCDLNRVCELAYQDIGTQGRLQFPRFVAWRNDKKPTAEECSADQDPSLMEILQWSTESKST